ncbi:MAG: hypothetical protein ACXWX5_04495 [Actinomycetota bacterium]
MTEEEERRRPLDRVRDGLHEVRHRHHKNRAKLEGALTTVFDDLAGDAEADAEAAERRAQEAERKAKEASDRTDPTG